MDTRQSRYPGPAVLSLSQDVSGKRLGREFKRAAHTSNSQQQRSVLGSQKRWTLSPPCSQFTDQGWNSSIPSFTQVRCFFIIACDHSNRIHTFTLTPFGTVCIIFMPHGAGAGDVGQARRFEPGSMGGKKKAAVLDCGSKANCQPVQAAWDQAAFQVSEEAVWSRQLDASKEEVAKADSPVLSPPRADITIPSELAWIFSSPRPHEESSRLVGLPSTPRSSFEKTPVEWAPNPCLGVWNSRSISICQMVQVEWFLASYT